MAAFLSQFSQTPGPIPSWTSRVCSLPPPMGRQARKRNCFHRPRNTILHLQWRDTNSHKRRRACVNSGESCGQAQEAPFGAQGGQSNSAASPNLVYLPSSSPYPTTLTLHSGPPSNPSSVTPPCSPSCMQDPHPPLKGALFLLLGYTGLRGRCWARGGWARRGELRALGWGTFFHVFRLHGLSRGHFTFHWFCCL